jgi:hypothetical protein
VSGSRVRIWVGFRVLADVYLIHSLFSAGTTSATVMSPFRATTHEK